MKKSFFVGMMVGTIGTGYLLHKTKNNILLQKIIKK